MSEQESEFVKNEKRKRDIRIRVTGRGILDYLKTCDGDIHIRFEKKEEQS